MARQDQCIEPEMALQVDDPFALDIAEFAALDRMQMLVAGEKPLDRVKAAVVAAVDRHPLVPTSPVGGDEFRSWIGHGGSSRSISASLCATNGLTKRTPSRIRPS